MPMMNDFREVPEDVRQQLIARRDAFEGQFKSLVAELPLPSGINRPVYRNLLLSMINAVGDWYRARDLTPGEITSQGGQVGRGAGRAQVGKERKHRSAPG